MPNYKPVKFGPRPEEEDKNNKTITGAGTRFSYNMPGTSPTNAPDTGARTVIGNGKKFGFNIPTFSIPRPPAPAPAPAPAPVATGSIESAPGAIPVPAPVFDPMKVTLEGMATGANKYGETGLDATAFKPAFDQMLGLYQDRLLGYNSPQLAAQRAEQSQMINAQMLAAQRQNRAALASQGVRGAAALAGNQNIADQAINARAQMENALLAKQFEAQGGALANYNQFMSGERGTKLGSEFGYGNLYQTVENQKITNDLIQKYIESLPGGSGPPKAGDSPLGKGSLAQQGGLMTPDYAMQHWNELTPTQKAMFISVGVPFAPYIVAAQPASDFISGTTKRWGV